MGINWGAAMLNPTLAIGAATSGGLDYLGAREANETNKEIAENATRTNIEEARKNREFQATMSNTAFQRQKEDLIKAGINPLLMTGMSGASTPAGSTGNAETTKVENAMSGMSAGVRDAISLSNQMQKTKAEVGLMSDQQALTKAQTGKAAMETKVMSKGIPEADIKNSVYDWAKNLFKGASQSTALPAKQPKEIMDFHKKYRDIQNPHTVLKGPR